MIKRIAILTGGGHISSFHSGIKRIVVEAQFKGIEVIGFKDGYKGAKEGNYCILNKMSIPAELAGSCLGSTREKADERIKKTIQNLGIDALIVMGGDDHLSEAVKLCDMGAPVVGWPKTMDNDLSETYFCLGYPTAVEVAANMLRCAHMNAQTHNRIHLVTMFGRNTDWVVAGAAAWGHADIVVPCEQEYKFDYVFDKIQEAAEKNLSDYGRRFAVVAVAEGAKIKGLESHLKEDEMDVHGNPKIEPMQLALVLKDAFKKRSENCISIDSISYLMRDSPPVYVDKGCGELSGQLAFTLASAGMFGNSVRINKVRGEMGISPTSLEKVAKKRFLKPEGFIDYENLKVKDSFREYYTPLFGEPVERQILIYPSG